MPSRGIRNQNDGWMPIPAHDGYEAHRSGLIRSLKRKSPKILSQHKHKDGYLCVIVFGGNGDRRRIMVHRVVAELFIKKHPGKDIVCHNNGKLCDNTAENLRWATQKENILDKNIHGTMVRGELSPFAKLSDDKVLEIRKSSMSLTGLGKAFGVSRVAIANVKKRKTWKHV